MTPAERNVKAILYAICEVLEGLDRRLSTESLDYRMEIVAIKEMIANLESE